MISHFHAKINSYMLKRRGGNRLFLNKQQEQRRFDLCSVCFLSVAARSATTGSASVTAHGSAHRPTSVAAHRTSRISVIGHHRRSVASVHQTAQQRDPRHRSHDRCGRFCGARARRTALVVIAAYGTAAALTKIGAVAQLSAATLTICHFEFLSFLFVDRTDINHW